MHKNNTTGLILGLCGILIFSQTLPMSKLAIPSLGALFISFGRAALSGLFALLILGIAEKKPILRTQYFQLFIVGLCVVVGFPLLISLGLKTANASHGAVVIGLTPLLTAILSSRGKKSLPFIFWGSAGFGAIMVFAFVFAHVQTPVSFADLFFLLAALVVAYGYVLGANLSVFLSGWRVICWALVLCLPITLPLTLAAWPAKVQEVSSLAWLGFGYVTFFSQLIGFFFWYAGLALGDPAWVSQIQLVQGFLTVLGSALYLGEEVPWALWLCLTGVVASIYVSRKSLQRNAVSNS